MCAVHICCNCEHGRCPVQMQQGTIMNARNIFLAAALALASVGAAHADGLRPIQGQSIDLGTMTGIAYYTAEHDGFRVVATLSEGDDGTPVRFEAVLAPGQRVVLSTPRGLGLVSEAVEISRENDTMLVRKATAAVIN